MDNKKRLTIRVNEDIWQKARLIMVQRNKGETFQDICVAAIEGYVKENEKENNQNLKSS